MRRAVLPLLLLTVTACSSSSKAPEPTPSPTPSPTASPTPSPSASPTASPTPSPTASATPAARRVPAKNGDVDGDGTRDAVRASATLLTVELSSTGKSVTAPIHSDTPGSSAILGYADVDRDGRSEVFVETAEGASTQFVTPYRYDGKVLHEVQLDGGPARLGIGGSVTHGDGFRCTDGLLEVRGADSEDGTTYTVHVDSYRLRGADLVLARSSTTQAKQGDPAVEEAYSVDCGSVGG
jgi:hypothetical protein